MKRTYYAIFESDSSGGFGAHAPDFPGVISAGDSLEEAKKQIVEAIEFHLEDSKDVPAASDLDAVAAVLRELYDNDNIKIVIGVEVELPARPHIRVNITIPEDVLSQIDQYLKDHPGNNRSSLLTRAALEFMGKAH